MAPSERDWAGLPEHLLDLIYNKVDILPDHIRFSAVCPSWRSLAIQNQNRWHKTLPLLMIPTKDSSKRMRSLYSVTDRKVYDFQLHVTYNRRCCGSSYGWLVFFYKTMAPILLNPFVKKSTSKNNSNNTIHLPRLERRKDVSKFAIVKVVLSANPSLVDDYVVAAIYNVCHKLAFMKAGDKSWTYIDVGVTNFHDVIFYRGQILAVNHSKKIVSVDVFNNQVKIIAPGDRNPLYGNTYLVESSAGELLMVERPFYDIEHLEGEMYDKYVDSTETFNVYKLVLGGEQTEIVVDKIEEVKSLGEETLFLGDNCSISVIASKYPGLKKNAIYYTDDYPQYNDYGPRDTGIFSLEDRSFDKHYLPNLSQKRMPPPIWVVPTTHVV